MTGSLRRKKIKTVIGADTVIHGSLRFSQGAHIAGTVLGHVGPVHPQRRSTLSVDRSAIIHGAVTATDIELRGRVLGDVGAQNSLLLGADAEVFGQLSYDEITIEPPSEPTPTDTRSHQGDPAPASAADPRFQGILQVLRDPWRGVR